MDNVKYTNLPDKNGYYGAFGGRLVPPLLEKALQEVEIAFREIKDDIGFQEEYRRLLNDFVGRPSPLYYARNLSEELGGAQIYFKREDLNHTGAHKINHCLGEALLAKRLGKKKVMSETGAGQHGVALATAAAVVGLDCEIHMGEIDIAKQADNVKRMKLLGAKVVPVKVGGRSLKEAVDSAFGVYMQEYQDTFFAIGSVVGPHPYPEMVAYFQSIIGREVRQQIQEKLHRLPDALVACVGGGSNALGIFYDFLDEENVRLIGVEPSGKGLESGRHAATLTLGKAGAIHGMQTYVLQEEDGSPSPVHSIASGLDYPGIGPFHAYLKEMGRVEYVSADDKEAAAAFVKTSRREGIVPALESSHALAHAYRLAPTLDKEQAIIVNVSGRGDKDIDFVAQEFPEIAFEGRLK
ncbi:MAG: tryptophan synthase subunit beta [Patescibacteria group bacterium]|nr:tryptophan synthase subunit beta [Patescibacteria group bacterium]